MKIICCVCGKKFDRADKKQHAGNKQNLRPKNSVTCSKKCSKIYIKCITTYIQVKKLKLNKITCKK